MFCVKTRECFVAMHNVDESSDVALRQSIFALSLSNIACIANEAYSFFWVYRPIRDRTSLKIVLSDQLCKILKIFNRFLSKNNFFLS